MVAGPPHGGAGGKSGHRRAGCWLTARGGDPTDSATESRPPRVSVRGPAARVKRCGKSAPAVRVTGPARQTPPGARPNRRASPRQRGRRVARPGPRVRPLERPGNRSSRGMTIAPAGQPTGGTEPGLEAPSGVDLVGRILTLHSARLTARRRERPRDAETRSNFSRLGTGSCQGVWRYTDLSQTLRVRRHGSLLE